jgi:transposase
MPYLSHSFDAAPYRERNLVERGVNRLKRWQSVVTRYEKRASRDTVSMALAAIMTYLP